MTKLVRLRLCDTLLVAFTVAILASAIQLESTHSSGSLWVWVHIIVGLAFMALIAYHIYLHFGSKNWFSRFWKQKSRNTRILWWITLLALLSGIISAVHWLIADSHGPIGGVHGKIGFIMLIFVIFHVVKRAKFFKPKIS